MVESIVFGDHRTFGQGRSSAPDLAVRNLIAVRI
jgi:hypothetical protein